MEEKSFGMIKLSSSKYQLGNKKCMICYTAKICLSVLNVQQI